MPLWVYLDGSLPAVYSPSPHIKPLDFHGHSGKKLPLPSEAQISWHPSWTDPSQHWQLTLKEIENVFFLALQEIIFVCNTVQILKLALQHGFWWWMGAEQRLAAKLLFILPAFSAPCSLTSGYYMALRKWQLCFASTMHLPTVKEVGIAVSNAPDVWQVVSPSKN